MPAIRPREMSRKALFCIARSEAQASEIVNELKAGGVSNNDISSLFPGKTGTRDLIHERHSKAPEGFAAGGITGGIVCAGLGWLAGIGSLAIPGLGPFIAAGPILGALSAAAIGVAFGSALGSLIGIRFPEYEAKLYTGKLAEGNILLSVHCENEKAAREAKTILERANAFDIASNREVKIPESNISASHESKTAAENPA
jgi:uncharacterized protein (DUF697 family)